MSNETCTVTIADIYGEDWWERHKEYVNRDWVWEFRVAKPGERIYDMLGSDSILRHTSPAIVCVCRKPKPPTLLEVYGKDEVTIPKGWEWTGEFRQPTKGDRSMDTNPPYYPVSKWDTSAPYPDHPPRLILRERPKKVWFKAEEKGRETVTGDWFYEPGYGWIQNMTGCVIGTYLCATRHEEIDQTVQVVTQADVDKVVGR